VPRFVAHYMKFTHITILVFLGWLLDVLSSRTVCAILCTIPRLQLPLSHELHELKAGIDVAKTVAGSGDR